MFGFETIGSAVSIFYDEKPLLVTDPWITENAYFGSWAHDFEIPSEQMASIEKSPRVWFSHGHPDHLDPNSLAMLTGKEILLADHLGGRISTDLKAQGLNVTILPSRQWVSLSKRVRIMTIPNFNQDSILLVEMDNVLIVNLNDSPFAHEKSFLLKVAANYKKVFHLQLVGWGGADMQNVHTADGVKVGKDRAFCTPVLAGNRQLFAKSIGATHTIPFSSFHRYQRSDSVWANEIVPTLSEYQDGKNSKLPEHLPAFIRYEVDRDLISPIEPKQLEMTIKDPKEFGDDWAERLDKNEVDLVTQYFTKFEHVQDNFGFLDIRVGDQETHIKLKGPTKKGFTFHLPRQSLLTAIEYNIFDDLMIGNFMKVTVHGEASLYPDFSPFVCKFGDNGGARSKDELSKYFKHYQYNFAWEQFRSSFAEKSTSAARLVIPRNSVAFNFAKSLYQRIKY
jgi:hypothetical protein